MSIELNTATLEFICDDEGGRYKWYYDASNAEDIRINAVENLYSYRIPVASLPTKEEFAYARMNRFVKDGFAEYVPMDKLQVASNPRSQATLKLLEHKEGL